MIQDWIKINIPYDEFVQKWLEWVDMGEHSEYNIQINECDDWDDLFETMQFWTVLPLNDRLGEFLSKNYISYVESIYKM